MPVRSIEGARARQVVHKAAAFAEADGLLSMSTSTATIAARERTVLEAVDHAAFFGVLDAPPAPNARLTDAAERRRVIVAAD